MIIEIEKIKYYVEMTGKGKPVICLHGFAEDHTTWNHLVLPGYTLYKIDLLGHGKSDKPNDPKCYAMEGILQQLNKLIHELVKTNYIIMGYSMGGRLALAYAFKYRNEVDKLILESASFGIKETTKQLERREKDRKLAEKIVCNGAAWFEAYWSNLELFKTQKKLSESIRKEIKNRRLNNDVGALANTILGSGQSEMPYYGDRIEDLSMPILYVCGVLDEKYTQLGRETAEKNRNMLCLAIRHAGHNVHLEQAELFGQVVEHFLNNT